MVNALWERLADPVLLPAAGSLALYAAFGFHAFGLTGGLARARFCAQAAAVSLAVSFSSLTACFALSLFMVKAVYRNSSSLKPPLYKITAVWGNHEGSLLLFCLLLGGYVALFVHKEAGETSGRLSARVKMGAARVACASVALLEAYTLFLSDPFVLLSPAPTEGLGFNPLLQDIGLAIHPPTLYLGYAGLLIPYALAMAALRCGEAGREYAKLARTWTLASWGFLTGGIALGSAWAYRELGWGGFWFWDPVENASLMPWLASSAALHSLASAVRTGRGMAGAAAFSAVAAVAGLGGFFLVRSGAVTSVHAFASDPGRGLFLLGLFLACAGYAAWVFWRAPAVTEAPQGPGGLPFWNRSWMVSLQNVWMSAALFTVALGTVYPLLSQGLAGVTVSVGAPYFADIFTVLGAVLALLLAAGSAFAGRERYAPRAFVSECAIPWAGAWMVCAFVCVTLPGPSAPAPFLLLFPLCAAGFSLQCLLFFRDARAQGGPLRLPLRAWRIHAAHTGAWFVMAGAVTAAYLGTEKEFSVHPGDTLSLSGYRAEYVSMERARGPNYLALRCRFAVYDGAEPIGEAEPEARYYPTEQQQTAETAIIRLLSADVAFSVGEAVPDGRAGVRMMYRPGMKLIRAGAWLMVLSAMAGVVSGRRKVTPSAPS